MAPSKTKTGSGSTSSLALRKGAASPALRGSNDNIRLATASDADVDPAPSLTLTTTVSGTITIGTAPNAINVPISTTLPPTVPGDFVFYYEATSVDTATKIPVGAFIAWAAAQLGATTKESDLPTSLQQLTVAVEKLNFDTKGDFDIAVEIGKEVDGKFDADWTPITGLSLTISDVRLEFARGTVPPKPTPPPPTPPDGGN